MKHKLLREIKEDDKDRFAELRQSKDSISNSLKFRSELLFEILDYLFGLFEYLFNSPM